MLSSVDITQVRARVLPKSSKPLIKSQKFYGWIKSDETKKIVESPLIRESGFGIQEIFACEMWNPSSRVLESGIQLKESGILGFVIRNTAQ